jgi:uncharacterized protein YciI
MKKFKLMAISCLLLLNVQLLAQDKKETEKKYDMKTYYLVFLKKGPNRNQDSVTVNKLQEGHMAHLSKMAKTGKMDIAGPVTADIDLRGICIYNVSTKEEAEKLVNEDPMIKAGRLTAEIFPFYSAKGATLR